MQTNNIIILTSHVQLICVLFLARRYGANNSPIRFAAYDDSGRFIVVAGRRGFTLYSVTGKSFTTTRICAGAFVSSDLLPCVRAGLQLCECVFAHG